MDPITSEQLQKQQLNDQLDKTRNKEAKPVEPSKSTAISYNATLQKLVKAIKKDIDSELVPLIRELAPEYVTDSMVNDGWSERITAKLSELFAKWTGIQFAGIADETAEKFVRTADQINRNQFEKSMKSLGISVYTESSNLDELLQAAAYNNSKLIKSIPGQYLNQVENVVLTNMRAGLRPSAMVKQLQNQFGVSQNKARLIARDQTSKVNGDINKSRQTTAGFEYFKWTDSSDQRVRRDHEEIADKVTAYGKGVYRWDNPPLNDKGQQIIPGSEINCRCVAIPVSNSQVKKNQEQGKTNPSVKR